MKALIVQNTVLIILLVAGRRVSGQNGPFTPVLRVASIFSSNMVLQRGRPVPIWGKGIPGRTVTVEFARDKMSSTVGIDSSWIVTFPKEPANAHPQSIGIVSGPETIVLQNILIGDCWLCLGQSNMEFPMSRESHFAEERKQPGEPLLRWYNPVFTGKFIYGTPYTDSMLQRLTPQRFYSGTWQTDDSTWIGGMSAVAYYFGKRIVSEENIPVGLIQLSIGGCPLETFIRKEAMATDEHFAAKLRGNWLDNAELPVWARERGRQNIAANPVAPADALGPYHAYQPGFAWQAGIAPMLRLPIKGVLLYQGETNAQEPERVREYPALMRLMIADYRNCWGQPDLPFYWVQLSSIDTAHYASRYWPEFRNNQRLLLGMVSDGGMAVCSDIGARDDVHPRDKKDVGERLALWALNKTYRKRLVPSGPLPVRAVYRNRAVVVQFQYADGLKTSDGQKLRGFSFDGVTGTDAFIRDGTVVISATVRPDMIYYGWQPFTTANLINAAQLPASTFKITIP